MTGRKNSDRGCPPPRGRPTPDPPSWLWCDVPVPEAHVYLGIVAFGDERRASAPDLLAAVTTCRIAAGRGRNRRCRLGDSRGRSDGPCEANRVVTDGPYSRVTR